MSVEVATEKPSKTRYWVVVFAVALAVIQYIDRVCIAQSKLDIQRDLLLSPSAMSGVLSAFGLAYALFEIPSGWLGDRFGPRKALIRVVLWWSFFTIMTGVTGGFISLFAVRFLFGAGEAGCFPNLTRAFVNWLQPAERVRAQSILWLSARWGGAITPLLVLAVLGALKDNGYTQAWRQSFFIFGIPGIIWVIVFARWMRDNPLEHPGVNAAEKKLLEPNAKFATSHANVPWKLFLSSRAAWLLWLQYFCVSYVWYFYVTELPSYLKTQYGPDPVTHAPGLFSEQYLTRISGMPLFFGGIGCLISGFVTKMLAAKFGLIKTRRFLASTGLLGTALAMGLIAVSHLNRSVSGDAIQLHPMTFGIALGLASMCSDFTMPCSWGGCMDVGGRFAGTFSGSMNMMGNVGGFLCPAVAGQFYLSTDASRWPELAAYLRGNWNLFFWVMCGVALIGAISWLFIDPVTPLEGEPVVIHPDTFVPQDVPASVIEEL